MKARRSSCDAITPAIGTAALVTPLAKVIMSGTTP